MIGFFLDLTAFSKPHLYAFTRGLIKHNEKFFYTDFLNGYIECDISLTVGGPKNSWLGKGTIDILKHTKRHIIFEGGFIDRATYKQFGWGYKLGHLNFYNNIKKDKFKNLNIKLKEHNLSGENYLIVLQCPADSNLFKVQYQRWCYKHIKKLLKISKRTIILRKHPKDNDRLLNSLQKNFIKDKQVKVSTKINLQDDLLDTFCLITYNSNSIFESIINGVPIYLGDKKPAIGHEVSTNDFINPKLPSINNRYNWLNKLANSQWSFNECCNGDAWEQLKQGKNDPQTLIGNIQDYLKLS